MTVDIEFIDYPVCVSHDFVPVCEKSGWKIVRCPHRDLSMVNPRRKGASEIYTSDSYFSSDDFYYDYVGNKAAYQEGFRRKLQVIRTCQPRLGRLLDVGAAYYFFMEEANRFGFESSGVELAPSAARHARQHGEVFEKPLNSLEIPHKFSVITFIDSLEHFDDPFAGLRRAWKMLDDDGIVAVMVPNIDSRFARFMGNKWHLLLPEEHLFYFSPISIKVIMEKAGFTVEHLGTGGYGRSAAEIARVFLRGKASTPPTIEQMLKKVSLYINLGDLFAIGRKSAVEP